MFNSRSEVGYYRLFLIGVMVALATLLAWLIECICFGAQVRTSMDDQQASAGLGINVSPVLSVAFTLGSGLTGLGGGLDVDVLRLGPAFSIKYTVYFLLAVAVGDTGSIKGVLLIALVLNVFGVAGKYYVSDVGASIIYGLMVALLVLFPGGLSGRRA